MNTEAFTIDGIQIHVDGQGADTVLMLHGWPDGAHLWQATADALKDNYRCVRLTLPGFDLGLPSRPTALNDLTALFCKVVQHISPDRPVTLLIHDWGCVFGYEFAARHPELVQRIVAVDIGDHNSGAYLRALGVKEKLAIASYQLWLALAWSVGSKLSNALGNRMTRWMAHSMRCPAAPETIGWQMNYPYAMGWFGAYGGLRGAAKVQLHRPTLFVYGERKPFMFHSSRWLETLRSTPGCAAVGLRTGHWVMLDKPAEFHAAVREWLAAAPPALTPPAANGR